MKKVLLWIGGIVIVLVIVFLIVAALMGASVIPLSSTRSSVSQNYGYDGVALPGAPMPREEWDEASGNSKMYDTSASVTQAVDRVIIRTARMAIIAEDVRKTVEALRSFIEQEGGFVVSTDVSTDEGSVPSASVSLRIPAERLDAALSYVRQQALRVVSESVSGEDVTEEYVDVKARLSNLEASERQFLIIMKDARKTEDVLAVQREIERVRGEIESLTARKKYLEESAKLSSFFISIATDEASIPVVNESEQWRPLVVAKAAANAFVEVLKFFGNVIIWAIVFVPVWGTAILVVRYWRKRHLQSP
ncbi:MAG TPA: hypothetical protein DEB30_00540 [Candidatus Peribacter riflensis]|uniref:DUF4349 domain-containing protein n=1 Tax=Candidatus Peribacter riflensis TaxID=1735162 RepID=A0A0S1SU89_9BACT|nr:MAG: hypothetical protein PeribacterA2_0315 [Candidatus Peribacter riflensis]OGJ78280.1 MAG: hypothetical protein A2398_05335 [Candidatus Peribacteria bacterium RIFOXYB1_FULL_57_12]OGJ81811.1 MAG: hypothetical protein A2412_00940 [Candidatus Peribacteria bacterium RIFOXYC1_FULL_58_8]ALM10808.1 MAG: hypothetical protein PeribacterB2_0315 [Candidatus Peribacter riflensis]ALM11910.1 MAG: hypothetical protein PeribacterC2_0314 [Candidatus Peribacter riflensis]